MSRLELHAFAIALTAECSAEKIPGWRRKGMERLLHAMHRSPYSDTESRPTLADRVPTDRHFWTPTLSRADGMLRHDAQLVREALILRDGHFDNVYTGLAVTAHRRLWLLGLGLVVVLAIGIGALSFPVDLDPEPKDGAPSVVLEAGWLPVGMALLGALGSIVSAIQRLTADPVAGSIPAQLGSFTASLIRPLIGVVAALTVYLAARGGLAVPEAHPIPLLLLAAFTAGLTERLVVYREGGQSENARRP